MLISEFIAKLEAIKAKRGDVPVYAVVPGWEGASEETEGLDVEFAVAEYWSNGIEMRPARVVISEA